MRARLYVFRLSWFPASSQAILARAVEAQPVQGLPALFCDHDLLIQDMKPGWGLGLNPATPREHRNSGPQGQYARDRYAKLARQSDSDASSERLRAADFALAGDAMPTADMASVLQSRLLESPP